MFCVNCGNEIENTIQFCPNCGVSLHNNSFNAENEIDQWYYINNNKVQGPIDINSIILEINSGKINRDTLVWQKGIQNWITAGMSPLSQFLNKVVPSVPDDIVDNRYVWALATVPIFASWIVELILPLPTLVVVITIVLNIIFISLDISMLEKEGKDASSWLWLGIVLVPLYLFIRASKTDKNYAYGFTWCIMILIDFLL